MYGVFVQVFHFIRFSEEIILVQLEVAQFTDTTIRHGHHDRPLVMIQVPDSVNIFSHTFHLSDIYHMI